MRRKKRHVLPVAVLAVLLGSVLALLGCGGGSGADIPLLYSFNAGDSWIHETTLISTGTAEGLGDEGATPTNETAKTRTTTKVESVTAGGIATITVTTETLELVSNGEPQDLTNQQSQTVTLTMDKTGRVLSSVGSADAAEGLIESGSFLDPGDLESQLGTLIYPEDGKAKVGEQWNTAYSMPLSGFDQDLTVKTEAKLVSLATENGRQVATVHYVSKLPMDLELDLGPLFAKMFGSSEDGSTLDLVLKIAMMGDVQFNGTAKVDIATGQTISNDADGTMNVSLEVTEAPETFVPSDQRGPYSTKLTLTVSETLVD